MGIYIIWETSILYRSYLAQFLTVFYKHFLHKIAKSFCRLLQLHAIFTHLLLVQYGEKYLNIVEI